ncbi:MAG: ATP-NAD kinase [Actinomycetia bacterium]|nr:ATP-NAD kinase [Actinomycetes bacterium]MCP4225421.1 ATP-NAD kinase [Actinomycetes bacterium]MCP5031102.1 ATP-NAD kinase [Actinomycetes bacterium]
MTDATVGIIANPAAGKDIRRLVSAASPVSDMAKIGIVRRAAIGAVEGGATRILVADDRHALARRAIEGSGLDVSVLDLPLFSSGRDSQRAAAEMAGSGVGAVIVLGGDGTHRDVAKGWRQAPIVALSTGTNNVFPRAGEATVAGHAAGLVASGAVAVAEVAQPAKVIDVEIDRIDGSRDHDLSLVDVALTTSSFTGSRAVWDVASLRSLVTVIAEPASVGLSSIAASLAPTGRDEPGGVALCFAPGGDEPGGVRVLARVRCPIAPGLYTDVDVVKHRRLGPDEVVEMVGPGALSFDGERDVVMMTGERARLRVRHDGPRVIDVAQAMMMGGPGRMSDG